MGTSARRKSTGPKALMKMYRGNIGKGIRENLLSPQKIEKTTQIADSTMQLTLPFLPNSQAKYPLYWGTKLGIHFAKNLNESKDLKMATQKTLKSETTKNFALNSISSHIWNGIDSKIAKEKLPRTLEPFARIAFKKTLNNIMIRGVDAFEERFVETQKNE